MDEFIERRSYDRGIDERVAVLETKVGNHSNRIEENQETMIKLIDRLDAHIAVATDRDSKLESAMVRVETVVDNLTSEIARSNTNLETLSKVMVNTGAKVAKWETIAKTLTKVASIAALVIGAIWALITFSYQVHENTTRDEIHLRK